MATRQFRLALLAIAFAGACASTAPVAVTKNVTVQVISSKGDWSFDPTQARIQTAARALESIAGHPIAFEIDAARVPDSRQAFEVALAKLLEESARDLEREKTRHPQAFAYGMPLVVRVTCGYDVRLRTSLLDEPHRTLVAVGGAGDDLLPRGAFSSAIESAYDALLERRFATAEPEAIAPGDRALYFNWLIDSSRQYVREVDRTQPSGPAPDVVLAVLRLSALVGDGGSDLANAIHKWLVDRTNDYAQVYGFESDRIMSLPEAAPWRRAESAWSSWLAAHMTSLTDLEASMVARNAFITTRTSANGALHYAFEGHAFDLFALGLMLSDRWAKAGHPTARDAIFSDVVCPLEVDASHPDGQASCASPSWYRYAAQDEAHVARLAKALVLRRDPILTATAERALTLLSPYDNPSGLGLALMRALETDEASWRTAALALAQTRPDHKVVAPELRRLWKSYPARRGAVLYLLATGFAWLDPNARMGQHPKGALSELTGFPAEYEGAMTRADFASFLAQGPAAASLAVWLLPARTSGWSAVELLVPHFDAYYALAPADRGSRDPWNAIASYFCQEHDAGEIEKLWAYHLKREAARKAGDPPDSAASGFSRKGCVR